MPKSYRLVVVGGSYVGKTALIEQAVFGSHSTGKVSCCCCLILMEDELCYK